MRSPNLRVGRVLRASTRGFAVGCRVMREHIPAFGALVSCAPPVGDGAIYGLIYDVSVQDDPFVRQLVTADLPEGVLRDQRENRQVPIEVSVLAVGYGDSETVYHCLPPQPPVALDWLHQCAPDEVVAFTARFDYFRLVLDAREVPADELLAQSLRLAAAARPEPERTEFLVEAGRELARLLGGDLARLEGLLRRIRPARNSP